MDDIDKEYKMLNCNINNFELSEFLESLEKLKYLRVIIFSINNQKMFHTIHCDVFHQICSFMHPSAAIMTRSTCSRFAKLISALACDAVNASVYAAEIGSEKLLKWVLEQGASMQVEALEMAAYNGHDHIVKNVDYKHLIRPTVAQYAIMGDQVPLTRWFINQHKNGQLQLPVLRWEWEISRYSIDGHAELPGSRIRYENYMTHGACVTQNYKILEILRRHKIIDINMKQTIACKYGYIDMLKTIRNIDYNLCYDVASRYGKLEVIKWLFNNNPNEGSVALAAQFGHIELLEWSRTVNQFDNNYDSYIAEAIVGGQLNVLKYLHSVQPIVLIPPHMQSYQYALSDNLEMWIWLTQFNFRPTVEFCEQVAGEDHLNIIKWAFEQNPLLFGPNQMHLYTRVAVDATAINILEWLLNLKPKSTIFCTQLLRYAIIHRNLEIVQWMFIKGYPIRTSLCLEITRKSDYHAIYNWITEFRSTQKRSRTNTEITKSKKQKINN